MNGCTLFTWRGNHEHKILLIISTKINGDKYKKISAGEDIIFTYWRTHTKKNLSFGLSDVQFFFPEQSQRCLVTFTHFSCPHCGLLRPGSLAFRLGQGQQGSRRVPAWQSLNRLDIAVLYERRGRQQVTMHGPCPRRVQRREEIPGLTGRQIQGRGGGGRWNTRGTHNKK